MVRTLSSNMTLKLNVLPYFSVLLNKFVAIIDDNVFRFSFRPALHHAQPNVISVCIRLHSTFRGTHRYSEPPQQPEGRTMARPVTVRVASP